MFTFKRNALLQYIYHSETSLLVLYQFIENADLLTENEDHKELSFINDIGVLNYWLAYQMLTMKNSETSRNRYMHL